MIILYSVILLKKKGLKISFPIKQTNSTGTFSIPSTQSFRSDASNSHTDEDSTLGDTDEDNVVGDIPATMGPVHMQMFIEVDECSEGVPNNVPASIQSKPIQSSTCIFQSHFLTESQLSHLIVLIRDVENGASVVVRPTYILPNPDMPFGHVGLEIICFTKTGGYQINLDWFLMNPSATDELRPNGRLDFRKTSITSPTHNVDAENKARQLSEDEAGKESEKVKTLLTHLLKLADSGYDGTRNNCSQITTQALIEAGYIDRNFLESDTVQNYRQSTKPLVFFASIMHDIQKTLVAWWYSSKSDAAEEAVSEDKILGLSLVPRTHFLPYLLSQSQSDQLSWVDILDAGMHKKNKSVDVDALLKTLNDWRVLGYQYVKFQDLVDAEILDLKKQDDILKLVDLYRSYGIGGITVQFVSENYEIFEESLTLFKSKQYANLHLGEHLNAALDLKDNPTVDISTLLRHLDFCKQKGLSSMRFHEVQEAIAVIPEHSHYQNLTIKDIVLYELLTAGTGQGGINYELL